MTDETLKPAEEFAFEEMARLVQEKDAAGVEFQVFLRGLEAELKVATRRLEVAAAIADACTATKTRKPRKDKGVKRATKTKADPEGKDEPNPAGN